VGPLIVSDPVRAPRSLAGPPVVPEPARTAPHALQLGSGLSFEDWQGLGRRLARISNASAWWLGDWLLYGQRAYGRRYKDALPLTTLEYQTLRNYASVARRFDVSRRRDKLSFQHHAEVVALPEPDQDLWLERAERFQWSRNELRRRLVAERPSTRPSESTYTLRLAVTVERELRWREAAGRAQQDLGEWVASTVDAAAEATLAVTPPPAARRSG
jgi:hypothetical protein